MPYSSIKEAPKGLRGAGLTLAQMNIWARYYDAAKASGAAISPAAVAWTQFKKLYKKVGKKWVKRAVKLEQAPIEKIIFTHFGKEAIGMKHEKLVQKITELSDKFCPDIPVEIAIDNATFGAPSKPIKKSESSQEEILSNYLGSKRQFTDAILKYIPEGTKTLFDPMCGSSHILIEAAKHGIEIIGNDLCPLAYYYSAGIFQGERLDEKDVKTLKNSPPVSGWLSKSELKRPERLESKRLIDGLVIGAYKKFSKGKQKTTLAAMSLLLQHYFRGFAAFISEEEPYSKEQILGDLSKCIKDVNELIGEVGEKGKIFNKNILGEKIPKADVIYFDPPYFPAGPQEAINYFKHYIHANSVLMQKKFEEKDPTKEDIINFLPKLADKTNLLIVSASSPSAINWETELSKLKKNVKMIGISKSSTGSQPQGERANPVAARKVKEHLFCASDSEIKTFERLETLLFKLEGYDPSKVNDKQLGDDLRIVCFPEGTRIWDGWDGKPIEKFKVGDKIKTNANYGIVKKIYKRKYEGELIEIKPRLLPPVLVTPEHPIKVMEGRWCGHFGRFCRPPKCSGHDGYRYVRRIPYEDRLKAVAESRETNIRTVAKKFGIHRSTLYNWRRGERILNAKRRPLFLDASLKWKPAIDLQPKRDWLLVPKLGSMQDLKGEILDLTNYIDSEIRTGNGKTLLKKENGSIWYDKRDKLPRFIPISKELMNISGWYLAEGFGMGKGLRFSFNRNEQKFAEKVLNQLKFIFQKSGTLIELDKEIRLNFQSPLLEKIFKQLFGNTAHYKKIPSFIQLASKDFQFRFLKAYWQGDGSFRGREKNKRISTVSENIIWNLLSICNGIGFIPSVNSHLVRTGFKTPKPVVVRELCFNSGGFEKSFNKNYGIDDKFFYLPVSKISKKFFKGNVYNFEIEPDNSYCVPFIVHNCAKYSSILSGKKTEFKNKEECLNFSERVMREVLKRGKITFHPEYQITDGKAKAVEK